jgi:hypothetical protein
MAGTEYATGEACKEGGMETPMEQDAGRRLKMDDDIIDDPGIVESDIGMNWKMALPAMGAFCVLGALSLVTHTQLCARRELWKGKKDLAPT